MSLRGEQIAARSAALGVAASGYLLPVFCVLLLVHAIPLSPPPHPSSLSHDLIMRRSACSEVPCLHPSELQGVATLALRRTGSPSSAPFFHLKGTGITLYNVMC